jgi:hypothetical protein
MDLRARVAMTEATPPELYEGQRLAVLKAELLRLAGPADASDLGWFSPAGEQVRDARRRLW